jgi:hypothetical protein
VKISVPIKYSETPAWRRRLVRQHYIQLQNNLCYWCKQPLDKPAPPKIQSMLINLQLFPTGFFDHPVHLHHCHKTDLTQGAVHALCNAVLWQYHKK